jgi:hypothetical protein
MGRGMTRLTWISTLAALAPITMGARGCGPISSMEPAPDVNGRWAVSYDDSLEVEITIGGSTYQAELPAGGGRVQIEHAGTAIEFDLDCSRPEIVCPSEAWPAEVTAEQREAAYPHRMWVRIPQQTCSGTLRQPSGGECGEGTLNPECEQVCDGEVLTTERDTFGVINDAGDRFDLLLGGGAATNGVNCVLLGISSAHATLVTSGSVDTADWTVDAMTDGEIVAAYAGGCLWVGDPDLDEELEALVLGASVKFTTGFTASRAD